MDAKSFRVKEIFEKSENLRKRVFESSSSIIHMLNFRFCSFIFLIFALLCTGMYFEPEPIHCLCPWQLHQQCKDSKEAMRYINSQCWVRNLYYIPSEDPLPAAIPMRNVNHITYYPWVSVILFWQVFMCLAPHLFWKLTSRHCAFDLDQILTSSMDIHANVSEKSTAKETAEQFKKLTDLTRHDLMNRPAKPKLSTSFAYKDTTIKASYLTMFFIVTDMLYILSALIQFLALGGFLNNRFYELGKDFFETLIMYGGWEDKYRFPRVTFCDFEIRQMSNVQRYTAQCLLGWNLFIEKIFLCVWLILVMIMLINFTNFLHNLYSLWSLKKRVSEKFHYHLVLLDIRMKNTVNCAQVFMVPFSRKSWRQQREMIEAFVIHYISGDRLFVIWILSGKFDFIVNDLLYELWSDYCNKTMKSKNDHDCPTNETMKTIVVQK